MRHKFNSTNPEDLELEMVRYRVHKMRQFYTHLLIYIIGVSIYFCKTYFGAPFNFWPIVHINCFVMTFWTIVIAIQGIRLFFSEKVFGDDWEKRKMNEILKKDKQAKWR